MSDEKRERLEQIKAALRQMSREISQSKVHNGPMLISKGQPAVLNKKQF